VTERVGFTIEESARRLGHERWVSMRLFELLGSWVADEPDPSTKRWLATTSRHHGWHAELLAERLPTVRDLHPDVQTVAPNAELEDLFTAWGALDGPDAPVDRLVVLARVVSPHVVTAVRWHLGRCTAVADEAVARTLRFVLADLTDEWLAGEALLQGSPAAGTDHARDIRLAFERRLAASGGISGPGTLVDATVPQGPSSSDSARVDVGA